MTEGPRHTDQGSRPGATSSRRPGAGESGRHAADGPQEAERVVIRDKRKIKLSDGKHTKSTTTPDGETPVDDVRPTVAEAQPPAGEPVGATTAAEPAEPGGGPADQGRPFSAELESLRAELDERTRDLQRVSAEFANYRKRVERDRALVGEQATGNLLTALLPVLDDLDRARDHGDLVGPFGSVADQLTAVLSKFGLTPFGSKGDPFDPNRHEAVAHQTSPEVTEPTCVDVMRRGYLQGERLLRPALVAVADPE
ncbi:nucleotide exchange factor GrpE [Planosporangium sp. 12N6]|uniref:nucleotide exchange factor GrpE n=1 Tax=Planosporangium spinosum TaxID=3402278 RepID=UPI003CF0AF11